MKCIEISLLAFYKNKNLSKLLEELKRIGIKRIHYDVMDGIYVPNTTFCDQYINLLKEFGFEIEIHLMVENVLYFYKLFKRYNPNAIVFHPSPINLNTIDFILNDAIKNNLHVGLAFNIDEDFEDYEKILKFTSINLIMGVNAGFGGQKILQKGIDKLHSFYNFLKNKNLNIPIIFDGGVNNHTINAIYEESSYIVSGSFIMNSVNKKVAYDELLYNNCSKN